MNNELRELSDRHFRPDPQGVLAPRSEGRPGSVCVRVDGTMANSRAGQHLTWQLVNLLCRQFALVEKIFLDIAPTQLKPGVAPFGECATLAETVAECIRLVSGSHVAIESHADDTADVILLIGSSLAAPSASASWRLYADGWRYYVGESGAHPPMSPTSTVSIGPYLAACHGAGEVFKVLRGMKAGKGSFIQDLFGSAWTMTTEGSWEALEDGPDSQALPVLPHFYFAGAGAVAQAAALCLATSGGAGACTPIDHDTLDLTNDNRYVLSHTGHADKKKVALLDTYLKRTGIACKPVDSRWQDFATSAGRNAFDVEVRALERQYKFPLVLSCVDKNEPRHEIQNLLPRLIISGSTDGLTAKAAIFNLDGPYSCLKCYNPIQDRNRLIRSRLLAAKDMTQQEQADFCAELGIDPEELYKMLEAVGCGQLSRVDLERFAAGAPQMSVGFVSAAAGTLLAAQLFRLVILGSDTVSTAGSTVVVTFARAGIRQLKIGPEAGCDCESRMRERWRKMWK